MNEILRLMFLVITYYICTLHTHTNIHLYPIAFDYWFESHNCRSVCSLNCSRRIKSQSTQTLAHIHMYVRMYLQTYIYRLVLQMYLLAYVYICICTIMQIYLHSIFIIFSYKCICIQLFGESDNHWLAFSFFRKHTLRGTRYFPQTLIIDQYLPCNKY